MDAEREAAAFVASLDFEAVPDEALDRATLVVADSLGAEHAGHRRARGRDERTEEIRYPKGDERNPFSVPELREKFRELAAPVVGEASAETLWDLALGLPESDPWALCEATRP